MFEEIAEKVRSDEIKLRDIIVLDDDYSDDDSMFEDIYEVNECDTVELDREEKNSIAKDELLEVLSSLVECLKENMVLMISLSKTT